MNGETDIDAVLNPCSAEMDRKTLGWKSLNVCFWGKRLIVFTVGRLTVDIFTCAGQGRAFTCTGGGANGCARYWILYWKLGSVMWITHPARQIRHE
jgi:hypothetical protein